MNGLGTRLPKQRLGYYIPLGPSGRRSISQNVVYLFFLKIFTDNGGHTVITEMNIA